MLVEKSTNIKNFASVIWRDLKESNLVGTRLRKIRNEKGLSQEALAAKCQRLGWDASREMINHIEMQIRLVRDYEVVALAEVLDIPVSDILCSKKDALRRLGKK